MQSIVDPTHAQTYSTTAKDYVVRLYAHYADTFESHLVHALEYKTPTLLTELLTSRTDVLASRPHAIADLGCDGELLLLFLLLLLLLMTSGLLPLLMTSRLLSLLTMVRLLTMMMSLLLMFALQLRHGPMLVCAEDRGCAV
jgi:hypothetical protein